MQLFWEEEVFRQGAMAKWAPDRSWVSGQPNRITRAWQRQRDKKRMLTEEAKKRKRETEETGGAKLQKYHILRQICF